MSSSQMLLPAKHKSSSNYDIYVLHMSRCRLIKRALANYCSRVVKICLSVGNNNDELLQAATPVRS